METGSVVEEYLYFAGRGTVAGRTGRADCDSEYARQVAEVLEFDLPWPNTDGNRPRELLDQDRLKAGQKWAKTGDVVNCFPPAREIVHYPIAELNP